MTDLTGDLVFYLFAAVTVLSGFFVAFSRNIVHAGFALLFTLFGVAGLYASLGADFIAVTQVIVYIGGILVLILFAVMMTRIPGAGTVRRRGLDKYVPAGIFALLLFALLYRMITAADWPQRPLGAAEPTTAEIGVKLMTDYIFPFEYASLVLLMAMMGAAIMIRERRTVPQEPAPARDEPADAAAPASEEDAS